MRPGRRLLPDDRPRRRGRAYRPTHLTRRAQARSSPTTIRGCSEAPASRGADAVADGLGVAAGHDCADQPVAAPVGETGFGETPYQAVVPDHRTDRARATARRFLAPFIGMGHHVGRLLRQGAGESGAQGRRHAFAGRYRVGGLVEAVQAGGDRGQRPVDAARALCGGVTDARPGSSRRP